MIDAAAAGHGLVNRPTSRAVWSGACPPSPRSRACSCPPSPSRCSAWPRGSPPCRCAPACTASRRWSSATSRFPPSRTAASGSTTRAPPPTRFVSAADVLSGAADVRQFERKLVLVGVTALAVGDYRATPVADRMPDVEIHAQLIEGIVDARPALAPVVDRLARSGGARRGGRDPDPRGARRCPRPPRPRSPRPSPWRRWRSRSASTSGGGSCSTRRCRSSAWARCSRRCSARRWRRPRASAVPSAARWRGSARSPRASPASSRRRAASRWAACRPRPPPSPARRASISTRFSSRRARWAAISTTSSGSTPTGSSSSSATYRARGCRAACSWR